MVMWRGRAAVYAALLGVVAMTGCLDGPFARLNPNDPGAEAVFSLVASRDTLRPGQTVVVVRVVSDPPTVGYAPVWTVEPEGSLAHAGDGVFLMGVAPLAPEASTIRATFTGRELSITIIRAP